MARKFKLSKIQILTHDLDTKCDFGTVCFCYFCISVSDGCFWGSELLLLLLLLWNLHKILSSVVCVELTPIWLFYFTKLILGWEIDANARYYKWGWVLRHNNVELILESVIFHCVPVQMVHSAIIFLKPTCKKM